jgi:hypothetical protein
MLRDYGMIRIYADRKNGKLLGAETAAPGGEQPSFFKYFVSGSLNTVFLIKE